MDDFSKVKVGQRLWSPIFGWGKVAVVDKNLRCGLMVEAEIVPQRYGFDLNGQYQGYFEVPQSLFWDEVNMVNPLKPKEKEVKMFDPTKPYQRRDGKYTKIIYTRTDGTLIVLDANEKVYFVNKDGNYFFHKEDDCDLVNVPEEIEGWVNIYKSFMYDTEEESKDNADSNVFARVHLKVKKGEGL